MNFRKYYIKMCEKAEELQKKWKPKVGDFIFVKYNIFGEEIDNGIWGDKRQELVVITHISSEVENYYFARNKKGEERIFKNRSEIYKTTSVWIPTQEQLQKLCDWQKIWKKDKDISYWLDFFKRFRKNINWNELWLRIYMITKHNKIWDKKKQKWIKNK